MHLILRGSDHVKKDRKKKTKKKRCMSLRAGEVRRTRTLQSGYRGAGDDVSVDSPFYGFIPWLFSVCHRGRAASPRLVPNSVTNSETVASLRD